MTVLDEMEKYVRENIYFSVPVLQKKFNTGYLTARNFAENMVERGEAVFDGGNTYRCVARRSAYGRGAEEFYGIDPKLFANALYKCIERDECSISSLRRNSCTDLSTACSLLNAFVEMGYVSAPLGARKRSILISRQRFYALYGHLLAPDVKDEDNGRDGVDGALSQITSIINQSFTREQRQEVVKRLIAVLKNIASAKP